MDLNSINMQVYFHVLFLLVTLAVQAGMIELINSDYGDFVNLSSKLVGRSMRVYKYLLLASFSSVFNGH